MRLRLGPILLIIAGLAVVFAVVFRINDIVTWILDDTEYSTAYSEERFQSIQIGDTAAVVEARLGPPIEVIRGQYQRELFFCTHTTTCREPMQCRDGFSVRLAANNTVAWARDFHDHPMSTIKPGDTLRQVLASHGPPDAELPGGDRNIYMYSRPKNSGWHQVRWIWLSSEDVVIGKSHHFAGD